MLIQRCGRARIQVGVIDLSLIIAAWRAELYYCYILGLHSVAY